jgi:sodium/proline symporter
LLVCSSALTGDLYQAFLRKDASQKELVQVSRFAVIGIALLATVLAMDKDSKVLDLVSYAWAGFGAAFGPIVILSLFWRGLTRNGAAAGILVGAVTVVLWKQLSGGLFDLYEIVPGFLLCALAAIVVSAMQGRPAQSVLDDYDRTQRALETGRIEPAE